MWLTGLPWLLGWKRSSSREGVQFSSERLSFRAVENTEHARSSPAQKQIVLQSAPARRSDAQARRARTHQGQFRLNNGMSLRLCWAAACLLLCAVVAQAATPLSSLQYGVYGVRITGFEHDGEITPPPATPCTNPSFPNPCLPIVKADEDKVHIEYGPLPDQPVPDGAQINIVACYSNVSSFNRPWRANSTKTDIMTDKACKFKIKSNLTAATPGSVTFMPNEESPSSTVFIRVYVFDGKRAYGYAQVPGFFQIQRIETPSHAVKSAAIGMCFAGPVILALALPLDSYLTKRRKHS